MSNLITIKHRYTDAVIYQADAAATIKDAIAEMRGKLGEGEILDLRGADLQGADLQGADLRGADLQGAYLRGADLQGAYLRGADLQGADLQGAYLQEADLRGADLRGAYLQGAGLQGAGLQGAGLGRGEIGTGLTPENLSLPPASLEFRKLVVSTVLSQPEHLDMGQWHGSCGTTHCLAGWAVHLSGAAGYALEVTTSPSVAGALLVPGLQHLFYVDNTTALEALRAMQEKPVAQGGAE
jgi:hypothetical protein